MPGIGSTGLYIDAKDNHYAAQVVGLSYKMAPVWRDAGGKQIAAPTPDAPAPSGATSKVEQVFSGNFEVLGTFRDGTSKLFSDVPPASLFEPDTTPATPPASSTPAT